MRENKVYWKVTIEEKEEEERFKKTHKTLQRLKYQHNLIILS